MILLWLCCAGLFWTDPAFSTAEKYVEPIPLKLPGLVNGLT